MNWSIADYIAGTVVSFGSLLSPWTLRRWIIRRPLSNLAGGIAAVGLFFILFLFFLWNASLVGQQGVYLRNPHVLTLIIAFIAFSILTKGNKSENDSSRTEKPVSDNGTQEESRANIDDMILRNIRNTRWVQLLNIKDFVILAAGLILGALGAMSFDRFGTQKTYDDCILELVPKASTREAVAFIRM